MDSAAVYVLARSVYDCNKLQSIDVVKKSAATSVTRFKK
jgi:hypothetical protein